MVLIRGNLSRAQGNYSTDLTPVSSRQHFNSDMQLRGGFQIVKSPQEKRTEIPEQQDLQQLPTY